MNKNINLENRKKKSHFLLPPPAILEAYEKLNPGATEKILNMAEKEQKHRHEWENNALQQYVLSNRLGIITGTLVAIIITITSAYLASNHHYNQARYLLIIGFSSLAISSIATLITRKFERKPRKLRKDLDKIEEKRNTT